MLLGGDFVRKMTTWVVMLVLLLSIFAGCGIKIEECYSQIKEGENFGSNVDGYQKKIPHNYCLDVNLSTKARLFMVPYDLLDKPYFTNSVYNTPAILEGRFTKGYYDNEKLILCEEMSKGNFEYVVFYFATQKIDRITDEKQIDTYGIITWFMLCNTIEESIQ